MSKIALHFGNEMSKPELRLKSRVLSRDQTVALNKLKGPERLTRVAKPKGKRKIQSNPFISQGGEIEVVMNDEVAGSIPADGSSE